MPYVDANGEEVIYLQTILGIIDEFIEESSDVYAIGALEYVREKVKDLFAPKLP